jgi:4-amino-4-deoxy-L-arabinose transferase-like glycosyltransferase
MSIENRSAVPSAPIHPLAALATLALDGVFAVFEVLDPLLLVFTSVGVGLLGFTATAMVQRHLAKDSWGTAIAKGLVMGIIAGVPYPIASTVVGVPLLVWAGVHQWIRLPESGDRPLLEEPDEKR